jgi:SAM-dependent methyltransferase
MPKIKYQDAVASNKALWDQWSKFHAEKQPNGYDVNSFRNRRTSLSQIELRGLTDVKDKSLLHLMCHLGLDTLSWAREGAIVTGVDLSSEAIKVATQLSNECNISARFICCDVYDLPQHLDVTEKFDIIYMSYGVLMWLHDLDKWAELLETYLKPGGTFYLVEFHPFTHMFDEDWQELTDPYFFSRNPIQTIEHGSYADRDANISGVAYEWPHTLSEVITVLSKSDLSIDSFDEFPYSPHNCFPNLSEHKPGQYTIRGRNDGIPLVYSIKATYIPQLKLIKQLAKQYQDITKVVKKIK